MSRIFRQFDLDDGVVDQLPERFESRFKTVQREQIKSDDISSLPRTEIYSRTKVFLSRRMVIMLGSLCGQHEATHSLK